MKHFVLMAALLAAPAQAGVEDAVTGHILPALGSFAEAATALDQAAAADCTAPALRPAFNATFDAWMQIADIRIGPSEAGVLTISYWPDKKGHIPKTLNRLIADEDPIVSDPAAFAEVSVAARGVFALEYMLYDDTLSSFEAGSYACTLVQAQAHDLALQAAGLRAAWDGFLPTILAPGAEGNITYLDETEAQRAVYTQILASLETTADQRLGRPLGEPTRARPRRAEAWRSGRSLTNVVIATETAAKMAHLLADWELPATDKALAAVIKAAGRISDPSFQNISDPSQRLRVEVLAQAVEALSLAIETEVGTRYGITPGFNSADGD